MARPRKAGAEASAASKQPRGPRLLLRLTEAEKKAAQTLAEESGTTVSECVRQMIRGAGLRLSAADQERVDALAKARDVSTSHCLRELIRNGSGARPRPAPPPAANAPDFVTADQLRRIGININQQMTVMHVRGEPPQELRRLWGKLETLLDRIIAGEDA